MEKSDPSGPEPTSLPAPDTAQTPAAAAPEVVVCEQKKRTVGNIIYDFGVFGSIAWIGVAALSALSAHEAMHGRNKWFGWLRALNDNVSSGLSKKLGQTILKGHPQETIDGYAKGTTMFLTLGMGGNALMAPVKWLEDNRQSNAARIDHLLGTTPPDPETIAAEPKQTWKSVLSGRMLSWGTSYVAFLAMGPKLTGQISNWFGKTATNAIMNAHPHSNPATVRRWADIAAFDTLFTVITATITYASSRSIARKDDQRHQLGDGLYDANLAAPTGLHSAPAQEHAPCPPGTVPVRHAGFAQTVRSKQPGAKPSATYIDKLSSEIPLGHARV